MEVESPSVRASQIKLAPNIKRAKLTIAIRKARVKMNKKKTKVKTIATIKRGIAKGAAKIDRIEI